MQPKINFEEQGNTEKYHYGIIEISGKSYPW